MSKRKVAIIGGKKMYITRYTGISSAIFSHVDKNNHSQVHVTFNTYPSATTRRVGAKKAKHGNFQWTNEKVNIRGRQKLASSMEDNRQWKKENTAKAKLKEEKRIIRDLSNNAPSWFGKPDSKSNFKKVKK